jgi:5-formaminoimidazole-4-carboxamide-1-(beta)-D-ribofuranosyl 5'-monophosphate synthetase
VTHADYTIATLGSHSALQILKGGKDEGFRTLLVTTCDRAGFYRRFPFIDELIPVAALDDFLAIQPELEARHSILIPHGSFVAYLGKEGNRQIAVPYFGTKAVLDWEEDRELQRRWLQRASICVPRQFALDDEVEYPVIVKTYGAAGGRGYFYATSRQELEAGVERLDRARFVVQEYVVGVTAYIHYFYSSLTGEIEVMSVDRRYETNVDALGRIPLAGQQSLPIDPSYVVVGNSPLVLRESLLPEVYAMGERVVAASQELIDERGMFGPFCLETVITPEQRFVTIEISCRLVAGTNLFIHGSPYSWLHYDEPMSSGRRVAREIRRAIEQDRLNLVLG